MLTSQANEHMVSLSKSTLKLFRAPGCIEKTLPPPRGVPPPACFPDWVLPKEVFSRSPLTRHVSIFEPGRSKVSVFVRELTDDWLFVADFLEDFY